MVTSVQMLLQAHLTIGIYSLMGDLNCSDAYVKDAYIYDDPNKQLISWSEFYDRLNEYCKNAGLPTDKEQLVVTLKKRLQKTSQKVNDSYHKNASLVGAAFI